MSLDPSAQLSIASAVVGAAAAVPTALDYASGGYTAGVAVGLWLAAAWTWMRGI